MGDELDRQSDQVASPLRAGEASASVGGDSAGCRPEHGLRTGAGGSGNNQERDRADRTTRHLDTARASEGVDDAVHANLLPLAATAWSQDWESAEEDEAWRDL